MVKGVSRQVIVVHSPDRRLFDQAIFILREDAIGKEGVTDDQLLKEAQRLLHRPQRTNYRSYLINSAVWAMSGAFATGLIWLLTVWL